MNKRIMVIILMSVFIVFKTKSLFSAEHVRILWKKSKLLKFPKSKLPKTEVYWELMYVAPKFYQCTKMKTQLWKRMEMYHKEQIASHMKMESKGGLITITYNDSEGNLSAILMESYHCFPDTIDPRKKDENETEEITINQ